MTLFTACIGDLLTWSIGPKPFACDAFQTASICVVLWCVESYRPDSRRPISVSDLMPAPSTVSVRFVNIKDMARA